MLESFTFSRALHLMRYAGKEIRHISSYHETQYMVVEEGRLIGFLRGKKYYLDRIGMGEEEITDLFLSGDMIMGSWVEK